MVPEPCHFFLKRFFVEKMLTETLFSKPIAGDNSTCWCATE
jgi:hypothetical protein